MLSSSVLKFLVVGVAFPAAEGSRVFASGTYDSKIRVWNYIYKTHEVKELKEQRETGVRRDEMNEDYNG